MAFCYSEAFCLTSCVQVQMSNSFLAVTSDAKLATYWGPHWRAELWKQRNLVRKRKDKNQSFAAWMSKDFVVFSSFSTHLAPKRVKRPICPGLD